MGNLFAWRSTDPDLVPRSRIAIGGDELKTDACLRVRVAEAKLVVACWGKLPWAQWRIDEVFKTIFSEEKPWYCLGLNKDDSPKHPLYIRDDTKPRVFW